MAMVIGRVRMAWQRRDVRAQARALAARPDPAAARRAHPVAGEAGELTPERVWAEATREDRP